MTASVRRLIPNLLTLARLLLAPALLLYILRDKYPAAVVIFLIICLTDLLDGHLARALGAVTRFGAVFDVIADLTYILSALIALNYRGLAPCWFAYVVMIKFTEFALTSRLLNKRKSDKAWVFDRMGRISAALFFISPGILCLMLGSLQIGCRYITCFVLIAATVMALASSAGRIARCIQGTSLIRKATTR